MWERARGLWHSHVGWLFSTKGLERGPEYGKDLYDDTMVRWIDRLYLLWVVLSVGLPFAIGYAVFGTWQGAALGAGLGRPDPDLPVPARHVLDQLDLPHVRQAAVPDARREPERLAAGAAVVRRVVAQRPPRLPGVGGARARARAGRPLRRGDPRARAARARVGREAARRPRRSSAAAPRSRTCHQLRLDRAVDVAVDVVGADSLDEPVRLEHRAHLRLHAREAQLEARPTRASSVELVQLRRALRVDEVDALEVEHERTQLVPSLGELADAVLERLGGGEEEAAVEPQDVDAREGLVVGVLGEVAEHLRPGLAAEQRHRGPGRDVDEPEERQDDADTTPASTPAESTPITAATATQKSNRVTR